MLLLLHIPHHPCLDVVTLEEIALKCVLAYILNTYFILELEV